jgi:S-adenosylmethionine decarboxylase
MSIKGKFPVVNGKTQFGLHLMLDAYESNEANLNDMSRVFRFLRDLPKRIGMHILALPMVFEAPDTGTGFDTGGYTGIVVIAESHISIHTFPQKGFFTMDVYSCSDFSEQVDEILSHTKETFGFGKHELQIVKRGLEFPMG